MELSRKCTLQATLDACVESVLVYEGMRLRGWLLESAHEQARLCCCYSREIYCNMNTAMWSLRKYSNSDVGADEGAGTGAAVPLKFLLGLKVVGDLEGCHVTVVGEYVEFWGARVGWLVTGAEETGAKVTGAEETGAKVTGAEVTWDVGVLVGLKVVGELVSPAAVGIPVVGDWLGLTVAGSEVGLSVLRSW